MGTNQLTNQRRGKYAYSLQELALQKADVGVFAKLYEKKQDIRGAARDLVELRFPGADIEDARGRGDVEPKLTRKDAAKAVFLEYLGEPLNGARRK